MATNTVIIDGGGHEHNFTTHGITAVGSRATFKLNGSSIAVYRIIGNENNNGDPSFAPITTYIIDNLAPVSFTGILNHGVVYRQLFYKSQQLEEGEGKEHTLVIENTPVGRNIVWLDYLELVSSTERPSTLSVPTGGSYSPGEIPGAVLSGIVIDSIGTFASLFLLCNLLPSSPSP